MILINRNDKVSLYKKSFKYTYLHWSTRDRFVPVNHIEPLCNEKGQRPIGPTILVEWKE
jgi:hypothetical protein